MEGKSYSTFLLVTGATLLLFSQASNAQDSPVLDYSVTGPCEFENISAELFQFRSPGWPDFLVQNESCTLELSTDIPSLLEITSSTKGAGKYLGLREGLSINFLDVSQSLEKSGKVILPTSSGTVRFEARRGSGIKVDNDWITRGLVKDNVRVRRSGNQSSKKSKSTENSYSNEKDSFELKDGNNREQNGGIDWIESGIFGPGGSGSWSLLKKESFVLNITVLSNDCKQIINVTEDGVLENLAYPADTYCEYWLQAEEGRQISLNFTDFSVGLRRFDRCFSDSVRIDLSGSIDYANSETLCGSATPITEFRSESNLMNVLLLGGSGNFPGFSANYALV